MADFVKVASLSELPAGSVKMVDVGGASIAHYNVDGQVHATANSCPHRGGSLGEGALAGGIISCPWHAFEYEVSSGRCLTNPNLQIACYPVKLEGQDILVQV
jgi:nitrite reductase (NADH) small subunit